MTKRHSMLIKAGGIQRPEDPRRVMTRLEINQSERNDSYGWNRGLPIVRKTEYFILSVVNQIEEFRKGVMNKRLIILETVGSKGNESWREEL
ncbi:UNVERIFIED_CONTAM: hypothetical protein Sangu_2244800 [Sesamum angustifolium]|uniref:Uncharacterized protein n=1 Tax=Sesamum angustifolium TaxID=2727405 RepID=A0AAW2L5Y9_9LAMI